MTELLHGLQYETALSFCLPAVDSLALADFADAKGRIADLCCGAGLIGLLLLQKSAGSSLTGIDSCADACTEAMRNAERNCLSGRVSIVEARLDQVRTLLPSGSFDSAVCNPPYHAAGGKLSPDPARAAARSDADCPLSTVCSAAAWLVKTGGSFSIVYPAGRLPDLFEALRVHGFEPKRIRLIRHTAAHAPSLVLVQARRCGGVGLTFDSDLILYDADGRETAVYRAVCDR